jgi:hypothetical protein
MYNDATMRNAFGRAGFDRFTERFRMESMIDKVEKIVTEAGRA